MDKELDLIDINLNTPMSVLAFCEETGLITIDVPSRTITTTRPYISWISTAAWINEHSLTERR